MDVSKRDTHCREIRPDMRRGVWESDSTARNIQSQTTFKFKVYCFGERMDMTPAINIAVRGMAQAGFQDA
ncbi:hypothetical protein NJLHNGOC_10515 [Novacetimonas cocois]|uniref:Uncharacterized protein n=2 Tax=Novacetimonas cocois TaxID=1747507 RepID=A0A365YTU9_9PROT|nr:hypothetical protein NJLHNGOC_10515 [Novacetimonas cocois]